MKKYLMFLMCLVFTSLALVGCGTSEDALEEYKQVMLDKLQTTYGKTFAMDTVEVETGGIFNSAKKYYGYAYDVNTPDDKFYISVSPDQQTFKEQYVCKLLEPEAESTLRADFKLNRKYTLAVEVFTDKTLPLSETAINGDTVINSSTINYNVYIIAEDGESFNAEDAAKVFSECSEILSGRSFRGILRMYLVNSGMTEKVVQGVHNTIERSEAEKSIRRIVESNFEDGGILSYDSIMEQLGR